MKKIYLIIIIVTVLIVAWLGFLLFTPCNPTNQKTQEEMQGQVICAALPTCYKNIFTGECRLRGCGYSPYTAPGPFWIQTFVC